jgi:PAS domain S-box-containing protein
MPTSHQKKKIIKSPPQRYLAAAILGLAALAASYAFGGPDGKAPFLYALPAVAISLYLTGLYPTLFMVLFVTAAGYVGLSAPYGEFVYKSVAMPRVTVFLLLAALLVSIHILVRRSEKRDRQAYLRLIMDQTEFVCRCTPNGRLIYVNEVFCTYFNKTASELIGSIWFPGMWQSRLLEVRHKLDTLSPQNPTVRIEDRILTSEGSPRWAEFLVRAHFDADSNLEEIQYVGHDITALRQSERELSNTIALQNIMLDNNLVGMVKVYKRKIIWHNKELIRILGLPDADYAGQSTQALFSDEDTYRKLGEETYPVIKSRGVYRDELKVRHLESGKDIWVSVNGAMLPNEDDVSFWMFLDVTDSKAKLQAAQNIANHDALTGLPNRRLLEDRLDQALSYGIRTGSLVAVCSVDLDGLKPTNDRHGHHAGDILLKAAAQRMLANVRPYRWPGSVVMSLFSCSAICRI